MDEKIKKRSVFFCCCLFFRKLKRFGYQAQKEWEKVSEKRAIEKAEKKKKKTEENKV